MSFSTKIRRAFFEPRSVLRILQAVFAAWACMACLDFTVTISAICVKDNDGNVIHVTFPFGIDERICPPHKDSDYYKLKGRICIDESLGAQIFVIIASLSILYALFIILVYMYFDEAYKTKSMFPILDFCITGTICFFWIIGTLSLNSKANALQAVLNPENFQQHICREDCITHVTSFTDLNLTLLMGLLNIFLWASNLWFVFKETICFQNRRKATVKSSDVEQQNAKRENYCQPDHIHN